MNIAGRIAAAQLYFAREGASFTLPSPGTVGRNSLPGSTDAVWIQAAGQVDDFSINPTEEFKEQIVAVPGRRVLYDRIKSMTKTEYSWTAQDFGPLAVELGLASGPLTGSTTQFNPNSGGTKRFWLKAQIYDQDNALLLAFDSFGTLEIDGATSFGAEFIKPKMKFSVLYSTQESGLI